MVFPCLCTAVEVAVVRQGAGEGDCAGASHGGQTGPAQKFRVFSDFAGSGFVREKKNNFTEVTR